MLKQFFALIKKDIDLLMEGKEYFMTTFFFCLSILVIFNFTLPIKLREELSSGIYWVTFFLGGTLSLNRMILIEKENDSIDAILLSPTPRSLILFSKIVHIFLFMLIIQSILIPVFAVLYDDRILSHFIPLSSLLLLSTLAFSIIGALVSTITGELKLADVLLPVLIFPLLIPVLIASVFLMQFVLKHGMFPDQTNWIKLLIAYDLIFLVISYSTYEILLES